jgi:hypothetical protein
MHKQFFNEDFYNASQKSIFDDPRFLLADKAGLQITDMGLFKSLREESFPGQLPEKIPGIGSVVKASNRAYAGMANSMRWNLFTKFADNSNSWENPKLLAAWADFVNTGTGRASLGPLERSAVNLNRLFFSPRLMASRLKLLNPIYYTKLPAPVRREALKSSIAMATEVGTVAALINFAGKNMFDGKVSVGTDPTNADFGKARIGDTRIDFTAGFGAYIRLLAQIASQTYTSSTTGAKTKLGEGYKPLTAHDLAIRFAESKLAPGPSFVADLLKGKTWEGDPLTFKNTVLPRFTPMLFGDLLDVIGGGDATVGTISSILNFYGSGSMTYGDKTKKTTGSSFKDGSTFSKGSTFKGGSSFGK